MYQTLALPTGWPGAGDLTSLSFNKGVIALLAAHGRECGTWKPSERLAKSTQKDEMGHLLPRTKRRPENGIKELGKTPNANRGGLAMVTGR